ncbi:Asp-tRNA(Asn)/Glu-tRNA(Gln) amidotransferase subunit GatA [Gimesia aquarii]|uniref:Glutamyl-tRNA(Gln) amidotransferase subunit A n=1 Tax=Gimesia aquarii TaxID=2527964 RepID=A0A517W1G0_9PLAN|nr:Asp-tRNA(Asn)/Glu-tRNA(Gln) amidotransferase subunit GatA [Gimesia aquarii]QDT99095.1 Glutamyl-tRNA(Gln) amidotransferase subunit A [Gimesia aquarii]
MSNMSMTASKLLAKMSSGEISSEEITSACLNEIAHRDDNINAFLSVQQESALEKAREVDQKRKAGKPLGKLAGIPVALKDNICTEGVNTTCASKMLENFVPPYDAHIVERLKAADAVLIGKTNQDEFAMGSSTENSAFKTTTNPWNTAHAAGGSSGGSAAAVAAGFAPLALGSDTGGSIRQPASFCGVVGLKPTYGRVSRYGLIAFASSLDQIGPFAIDVTDAALMMEIIAGKDHRDTTSLDAAVPEFTSKLEQPLENLKVGYVEHLQEEGLHDEVKEATLRALDVYKSLGAELVPIELPHAKYCVATYYIIAPSEASSNLARYDGVHYGYRADHFENMIDMYAASRGEAFGDEVKRRIMLGTYSLSSGYYDAYYLKALKVRRLIRNDFEQAFQSVDIIASPVTPTPAFAIGEHVDDPLAMYLADIFTTSANLSGIPGISIPAGFSENKLPIGLQLLAPPLEEERLLRAARMFERETEWHLKHPE